MKIYTLFFFVFISLISNGQLLVNGTVKNKQGRRIEYASITITANTTIVNSVISDKTGKFFFHLQKGIPYAICCSRIGYDKDTLFVTLFNDTALVLILTDAAPLKAVTVISKKPVITRKADRYIINIENSFLANGYSALDLLQNSPGLWITPDGQIKLKGNKTVAVMINNVLQKMNYEELQDYLRGMKSEQVSKIEVITNPGAEFDAEGSGGLINIILKKGKTEGLIANANTTYKQQKSRPYVSPAISVTYKSKMLVTFASFSYVYDYSKFFSTSNITYPNDAFYNIYTDIDAKKKRQQFVSGITYDLPKGQFICLQNSYTASNAVSTLVSATNDNINTVNTTGISNAARDRISKRNSTTFNYSKRTDSIGSTLSVILDYTFSRSTEINAFDSKYSNSILDSVYKSNAPYATNLFSAQADYKYNVNKNTVWKTGIKYSTVKRDNDLQGENFVNNVWELNASTANHFRYYENIFAAYSSVNKTIKKYDIALGVRAELTSSRGKAINTGDKFANSYCNIFPSVNVQKNYNTGKGHSLYFSFSSRLSRPDFLELNPYKLKTDNYTYQIGNPELKPQYSYSLDAGINLFNAYNLGINYVLTKNSFATLLSIKANNVVEYQVQNFKSNREAGVYVSIPFKIQKGWTAATDLYGYYLQFQLQNYRNSQTTFSIHHTQNIAIKKMVAVDIVADYRSPYVYSNARVPYQFNTNLGLSKSILKNKAKVRLLLTDVFNTQRDKTVTRYNNTTILFYQKRPSRMLAFTFSYNISSGVKFRQKSIQQNNNEEKARLDR